MLRLATSLSSLTLTRSIANTANDTASNLRADERYVISSVEAALGEGALLSEFTCPVRSGRHNKYVNTRTMDSQ
jgi:hypothetical protein